eukprot:5281231-Pleurochrysis_carterae.AAC.1
MPEAAAGQLPGEEEAILDACERGAGTEAGGVSGKRQNDLGREVCQAEFNGYWAGERHSGT